MKHASGIARLIQSRGPESYCDSFDNAILKSFRGVIVSDLNLVNGIIFDSLDHGRLFQWKGMFSSPTGMA
jgi:hypothetical protein